MVLTNGPECANAREAAAMYGNLKDRVFLVTGASSGIGFETALSLVRAGGTVIMACREGNKSHQARDRILLEANESTVILIDLDLGSEESVKKCVDAFLALELPLDALVNNAGINGVEKWGPGIETQFAVNFLGHFYLTFLLHQKLLDTPGSRVVCISSESHCRVQETNFDLNKELPPKEENYDSLHGYAFSNLARIWWVRVLSQKVPYPVVSLHPGVVAGTGMLQHMSLWSKIKQLWLIAMWEGKSALAGQNVGQVAKTQTWAAVAPSEIIACLSGLYLNGNAGYSLGVPMQVSELAGNNKYAEAAFAFAERYFKCKY